MLPSLALRRRIRRSATPRSFAVAITASMLAALVVAPPLAEATSKPHHPTLASGAVDVLYAGSLFNLMQQKLDPAFHKATGYSVSGFPNGSTALATEIRGGTQVGDVFLSASPSVNGTLEGAKNGSWVSSYEEFGSSPLVLGYNPSSTFATALRKGPWFNVVDKPGFLLGRTDPATDPKGVLAVDALRGVALSCNVPSLKALASSASNVFPESALVGRLQAGQLDAGFLYTVEAAAAHIRTVPLTATRLAAHFTVAILKNAPHRAAAKAFVKFLLSAAGHKILASDAITPIVPPEVFTASP